MQRDVVEMQFGLYNTVLENRLGRCKMYLLDQVHFWSVTLSSDAFTSYKCLHGQKSLCSDVFGYPCRWKTLWYLHRNKIICLSVVFSILSTLLYCIIIIADLTVPAFKGIVYAKMEILSSSVHPHLVSKLHDYFLFWSTQKNIDNQTTSDPIDFH